MVIGLLTGLCIILVIVAIACFREFIKLDRDEKELIRQIRAIRYYGDDEEW